MPEEILFSPEAEVVALPVPVPGGGGMVDGVVVANVSGWDNDAQAGSLIVLAPRREFSPATGAPEAWKPLALGGRGTAAITQALGWGEVLDFSESADREANVSQTAAGRNVYGGTSEGQVVQTILIMAELLSAEDVPAPGDFYVLEDMVYEIMRRVLHRQDGEAVEMTVVGIRWEGLTGHRAGQDVSALPLAGA